MRAAPWRELRGLGVLTLILLVAPQAMAASQGEPLIVNMHEAKFLPSKIAVNKGGRITFKNDDPFEHTLYIVSPDRSQEVLPETVVKGGTTYTFTADAEGVFILYCTTHGGMKGLISTTGSFDLPKVVKLGLPLEAKKGEKLFWGKARCFACHKIGDKGTRTRGPNLEDIGFRADKKAKDLGLDSGTAYLIQSLADPSAHVVPGYKDDMEQVYLPPLSLTPQELKEVIVYLQSQGGKPDPFIVTFPSAVRNAVIPWAPYMRGSVERGQELFFDESSPVACGKCHQVNGHGGTTGPDLTGIGGIRNGKFLLESILNPSAKIAPGFETVLIATKDGRLETGLITAETREYIDLVDPRDIVRDGGKKGKRIAKDNIKRQAVQSISMMPGNFAEVMTVEQLHDVLAYLASLK